MSANINRRRQPERRRRQNQPPPVESGRLAGRAEQARAGHRPRPAGQRHHRQRHRQSLHRLRRVSGRSGRGGNQDAVIRSDSGRFDVLAANRALAGAEVELVQEIAAKCVEKRAQSRGKRLRFHPHRLPALADPAHAQRLSPPTASSCRCCANTTRSKAFPT